MSLSRKLIPAGSFGLAAAALCLIGLAAGSSGCTSDEGKAVVELCGDLSVPQDIESVRVVIYDQNRTPLREGVRELWTCPGPNYHHLPQAFEFESVEGDVFVEVQGLKEGVPVVRSELRTTLGPSANKATVSLTSACMGARCAAGETCVRGECELVALAASDVSSCSIEAPSGGPDASGSSTDATSNDAEDADAGSTPNRPETYLCADDEDEDDAGSPGDASDQDALNADAAEEDAQ